MFSNLESYKVPWVIWKYRLEWPYFWCLVICYIFPPLHIWGTHGTRDYSFIKIISLTMSFRVKLCCTLRITTRATSPACNCDWSCFSVVKMYVIKKEIRKKLNTVCQPWSNFLRIVLVFHYKNVIMSAFVSFCFSLSGDCISLRDVCQVEATSVW